MQIMDAGKAESSFSSCIDCKGSRPNPVNQFTSLMSSKDNSDCHSINPMCLSTQGPTPAQGLPVQSVMKEDPIDLFNECFSEDDGLVVQINHERPFTPAATQEFDTSWLDDFTTIPYNFDDFDLDNVLHECGWNDSQNVLWKIANPVNLMDVDGPGIVDGATADKLLSSLSLGNSLTGSSNSVIGGSMEDSSSSGNPERLFPIVPQLTPESGYVASSSSQCSDSETPPKRLKFWEQKCEICGLLLLGGQQRYEAHMKNAHEIWCLCGLSFKNKTKLTSHLKAVESVESEIKRHGVVPGGKIKPMFECDFCDEIFRHRNLAVRHRNTVHLNMPDSTEIKRSGRKRSDLNSSVTKSEEKKQPKARKKAVPRAKRSPGKPNLNGGLYSPILPLMSQIRPGNTYPEGCSDSGTSLHVESETPYYAGFCGATTTVINFQCVNSYPLGRETPSFTNEQDELQALSVLPTGAIDNSIPEQVSTLEYSSTTVAKKRKKSPIGTEQPSKTMAVVSSGTNITGALVDYLLQDPKPPGWIHCSHESMGN